MLVWLLVWMLVFKFCNEYMLIRNYSNMRNMTVLERLEWDRIPFNYRGTEYEIMQQRITSVLNCFILTPFAVVLQYLINRHRILKGAMVSFLFILSIELIQLSTSFGNFATEDFITNMISYFVGVGLYQLIFRRLSLKANVILFSVSAVLCAALTIASFMTALSASDTLFKLLTHTF